MRLSLHAAAALHPPVRLTQIDRYLLRQMATALVAVTGGLVALIWLTQSLRFIELVVNREGCRSGSFFLQLTGLLIPSFVAVILPITTYRRGTVRLSAPRRRPRIDGHALGRPVAAGAVAPGLAGTVPCHGRDLLSAEPLDRARPADAAFREYQFEIRNRVAAFLLQEGVFTPVSDDMTVYVRSRDPDGTLRGILVDDARHKNSSHATILAERGRLLSEGNPCRGCCCSTAAARRSTVRTGGSNILTFCQNAIDLGDRTQPRRAARVCATTTEMSPGRAAASRPRHRSRSATMPS